MIIKTSHIQCIMMAFYIYLIFSKRCEAWKLHYMKWKRAREPNMPILR